MIAGSERPHTAEFADEFFLFRVHAQDGVPSIFKLFSELAVGGIWEAEERRRCVG